MDWVGYHVAWVYKRKQHVDPSFMPGELYTEFPISADLEHILYINDVPPEVPPPHRRRRQRQQGCRNLLTRGCLM